jgi:hypothetical protein
LNRFLPKKPASKAQCVCCSMRTRFYSGLMVIAGSRSRHAA